MIRYGSALVLFLSVFGCSPQSTERDEDNGCYVLAEALGTRFCCDWEQEHRTGYLAPRQGGRGCWITECFKRDDGGKCQHWSDREAQNLIASFLQCEMAGLEELERSSPDASRAEAEALVKKLTRACNDQISDAQHDYLMRRAPLSVLEVLEGPP